MKRAIFIALSIAISALVTSTAFAGRIVASPDIPVDLDTWEPRGADQCKDKDDNVVAKRIFIKADDNGGDLVLLVTKNDMRVYYVKITLRADGVIVRESYVKNQDNTWTGYDDEVETPEIRKAVDAAVGMTLEAYTECVASQK